MSFKPPVWVFFVVCARIISTSWVWLETSVVFMKTNEAELLPFFGFLQLIERQKKHVLGKARQGRVYLYGTIHTQGISECLLEERSNDRIISNILKHYIRTETT